MSNMALPIARLASSEKGRMMHSLSRRQFLRLSAGAAVILGAPQVLAGCVGKEAAGEAPARVAAVRGSDLDAMARDALDSVGGAAAIVNPGETVFIKPNMVTLPWAPYYNPFVAGECTKAEVVIAVIEECLKAGAGEVIVGDGSQAPTFSWEYATTLDGAKNLVEEAARLASEYSREVTLACLDSDSPQWLEVPSRTGFSRIAVSSLVAQADRVISIPVLKTHQWAQATLSLKNFVGVTPLERYGWTASGSYSRVLLHVTSGGIEQVFLDVVDAVKPDLAIIDASIGVEGNGPTVGSSGGLTVNMQDRLGSWLLLASTDLVAADATMVRIIGHDVPSVKHLGMAHEMGLGEIRESSIEIVGDTLENLRVDWLRAEPASAGELRGPEPKAPFYVARDQARHHLL
jgi:uncharacterized protein (DUF362 family)